MIRQRDNVAIYKVVSENTNLEYYVELLRLQNNYYGNPRFEAHILKTELIKKYGYSGAWVYRFTGHYLDDYEECKFIVNYHEKKIEHTHSN